MGKRHHFRRPSVDQELDMTTFMNLMVVLVPFLLITAVFSRITIVELSLPSSAGGAAPTTPNVRIEVIVRDEGLELSNGSAVVARMPKTEDGYDLEALSEHVVALKQQYPDKTDASVLLEPDIEYDHLIQVMDVVRGVREPTGVEGESTTLALFTDISIGDAP